MAMERVSYFNSQYHTYKWSVSKCLWAVPVEIPTRGMAGPMW